MILLIDNYDSFTYNLYQYIGNFNTNIMVIKNDELTLKQINELTFTHLIISPGPKTPSDAGICLEVINYYYNKVPILGICLGHQALAQAFESTITNAQVLIHGLAKDIHIASGNPLFKGLPPLIKGASYHSLVIDPMTLSNDFQVIAIDTNNEIMGIKHNEYPVFGLQFHPESYLSEYGYEIIANFLEMENNYVK